MSAPTPQIVCEACSIFRAELEKLRRRGEIDFPIRYLTSMLHMQPDELRARLDARVADDHRNGTRALLMFGECHDHMDETEASPGACRVHGQNCMEILLGSERYRALRGEGAFFLLPEWAMRWREVFEDELGLTGQVRREFMQEMHRRLVYLDTGQIPVPVDCLREISEALGLPYEVIQVSEEHLLARLQDALQRMADDVA